MWEIVCRWQRHKRVGRSFKLTERGEKEIYERVIKEAEQRYEKGSIKERDRYAIDMQCAQRSRGRQLSNSVLNCLHTHMVELHSRARTVTSLLLHRPLVEAELSSRYWRFSHILQEQPNLQFFPVSLGNARKSHQIFYKSYKKLDTSLIEKVPRCNILGFCLGHHGLSST